MDYSLPEDFKYLIVVVCRLVEKEPLCKAEFGFKNKLKTYRPKKWPTKLRTASLNLASLKTMVRLVSLKII